MTKQRKRKELPAEPVCARVDDLTHEGRGVARVGDKTVFIDGALPGEEVTFLYSARKRHYDEAVVHQVSVPSPERVQPRCAHYGVCGGCSLQHLEAGAQVRYKERVLLENLRRIGHVEPAQVLEPLAGPSWGYRRKARLGVKFVVKKGKLLVGFRERRSAFLADLTGCEVLHPSVGRRLGELASLIGTLAAYERIAQIEVAVDDTQTALVLRNLMELEAADRDKLVEFARASGCAILLQPGGPDSVQPLWPPQVDLHYRLEAFDVELHFQPSDFTQVNGDINRAMVERAVALLDPQPHERVLDLFCGLGNFTLPIARRAGEVVGVEGDKALVERAGDNARRNGLDNARFYAADLAGELEQAPWWEGGFAKVLLDPPRSGAQETLAHIARLGVRRIVYVSCNPATLARDAGLLVNEYGYRLERAGAMDMFPHTAHVESIAVFMR